MHMEERILILVTRGVVGGAQTFVYTLAKGLSDAGEQVAVAFGDGNFLSTKCAETGVQTHTLRFLRRSVNPLRVLFAVVEIRKVLRRHSYTVLHINSSNALVGAIAAHLLVKRPRIVFTFHGLSLLDEQANVSVFVRRLYIVTIKLLLCFVDEVVFVSDRDKEKALRCNLVKEGVVIHNGIESSTKFLPRVEAREALEEIAGIPLTDAFLVGSVGRLSAEKNYEFLIRAWLRCFKDTLDAKLVIVGGGSEYNRLEQYIQEERAEESIILIGEVPNASRLLKAFDVFALGSRYEGMSISILESLFADVPVVASDVGAAREQVPKPDVQVFALDDEDDFCEKLTALYENTELRIDIISGSKALQENFSAEIMVRLYRRVYTDPTHS